MIILVVMSYYREKYLSFLKPILIMICFTYTFHLLDFGNNRQKNGFEYDSVRYKSLLILMLSLNVVLNTFENKIKEKVLLIWFFSFIMYIFIIIESYNYNKESINQFSVI